MDAAKVSFVLVLFLAMQVTRGYQDPRIERKEKAIMVNDQAKVIARFIDDFANFIETVVEGVKTLWSPPIEKGPDGKPSSNVEMMLKYMGKSVQYGFQALKSSIPALRVTKNNVIEVSNVLPSVPITDFIDDIVKQFTPAFSRTFQDNADR